MKSGAQRWSDMGESTFVLGIWVLYWIYRLFGRWPFLVCLYPVVVTHWLLHPTVRRASHQYLVRLQSATGALGHAVGRLDSLRHLTLFAQTMLDKLLAVSGQYPIERVHMHGTEKLFSAIDQGLGGVIVTAHMGCLELCRVVSERRAALRLNVLVHTRHAEKFNRVLRRLGQRVDLQVIEVTEVGPATALMLAERVAAGQFVVLAGDRVPIMSSQTVRTNFLGFDAPFPIGPYVIASVLKCPLYLIGCIHEAGGYSIRFEELATRVELPREARQQALEGYVQRYARSVTELVVLSPYDWFNFFPFWDQVDGHPSAGT